jgi:hypothetical protein
VERAEQLLGEGRLDDLNPELPKDDADRVRAVAHTVADALDPAWVRALPEPGRQRRLTPAALRHHLVAMARCADARIVLPEGAEPRTVQAAVACAERGIARSVLLATPAEIGAAVRALGISLPHDVDVVDPATVSDRYVERLVTLRTQGYDAGNGRRTARGPDHRGARWCSRPAMSTGSFRERCTQPRRRCGRHSS